MILAQNKSGCGTTLVLLLSMLAGGLENHTMMLGKYEGIEER